MIGVRLHRAALVAVLLWPAVVSGQSLTDRTPNLSGGWVGGGGQLHFHFLHRFDHSGSPQRQVVNRPTFLLAGSPVERVLAGVQYATRSDVVAGVPNEWELFARALLVEAGTARLSLTAAWNDAVRAANVELSGMAELASVRFLGAVRWLGPGGGRDGSLFVGGGAVVPLAAGLRGAVDAGTVVGGGAVEEADPAVAVGLHARIPGSPHTLSVHASTAGSATLRGASTGSTRMRWGFEFTVPITPGRWFSSAPTPGAPPAAEGGDVEVVVIRDMAYARPVLTVAAGTTVVWRNEDAVMHTVTAADGGWDSGPIPPGGEWRRTFDRPGSAEYFCRPHPFMRARVEVRE